MESGHPADGLRTSGRAECVAGLPSHVSLSTMDVIPASTRRMCGFIDFSVDLGTQSLISGKSGRRSDVDTTEMALTCALQRRFCDTGGNVATSKTHGEGSNGARRVLEPWSRETSPSSVRRLRYFLRSSSLPGWRSCRCWIGAGPCSGDVDTDITRTRQKFHRPHTISVIRAARRVTYTTRSASLELRGAFGSNSTGVPANVIKAIMRVESARMLNARSRSLLRLLLWMMQVGSTRPSGLYEARHWMWTTPKQGWLAVPKWSTRRSPSVPKNWIQVAGAISVMAPMSPGTTTIYMQLFLPADRRDRHTPVARLDTATAAAPTLPGVTFAMVRPSGRFDT